MARKCINCDKPMPPRKRKCPACGAVQKKRWKWISKWWARWQRVETATKKKILAAGGAVGFVALLLTQVDTIVKHVVEFRERNSYTTFAFSKADPTFIYLNARNTGRKPSQLQSCVLHFGAGIDDARLTFAGPGFEIPAKTDNPEREILLTINELVLYKNGQRYTKEEVERDLKESDEFRQMDVVIQVDVMESNSKPEQRFALSHVQDIGEFLLGRMSG
jgi:hypothetical protein